METRQGGLKAAQTNKSKEPDFYKRIGKIGGQRGTGGGFAAMPKHLVAEYGRRGGSISRRSKKVVS